jgi:hypothetical protein
MSSSASADIWSYLIVQSGEKYHPLEMGYRRFEYALDR